MSKSQPSNPTQRATVESLEDAVYKTSLAEGNDALKRSNPLVTLPTTALTFCLFAGLAFALATQARADKAANKKTVGIDLTEAAEEEPPPPPPPPPPPAPVVKIAPPKLEIKEPPPPPPDPTKEIVPDIAPKELPKVDLSLAYQPSGTGPGGPGGPAGVGPTGVGPRPTGAPTTPQKSEMKFVEIDFSQVTVKHQPPLTYPKIAQVAKIQGQVVVEILVGEDGIPIKATALEGPSLLRLPAEQYAMQWRFAPQMHDGVAQKSKFSLKINYKLKN